jgi:hypothetical protein
MPIVTILAFALALFAVAYAPAPIVIVVTATPPPYVAPTAAPYAHIVESTSRVSGCYTWQEAPSQISYCL